MPDLSIPYKLLDPSQQALVDTYVDFQMLQLNPDSKEKMLKLKEQLRTGICTKEGIRKLEVMHEKGEGPFMRIARPAYMPSLQPVGKGRRKSLWGQGLEWLKRLTR